MSSSVYLSDLTPTEGINGWGAYERDRSNGESGATDGRTLTLNGTTYTKGLGVHSFSSLTYSLGGLHSRFQSFIGIDDEVGNYGSVIFRVLADGVEIFRSGTLTGASASQFVDLDVAGRQTLQLIVDNADGSAAYDHANWADAKLINVTAPQVIDPNGAVRLLRDTSTDLVSVQINGVTTPLRFQGSQVKTNQFSGWQILAAETVGSNQNQILWMELATGRFHFWSVDSNWNYISSGAIVDPSSSQGLLAQQQFMVDPNGIPLTTQPPATNPTITLTAPPAPVAEDGMADLVYTFTRTGSTSSALSANYTVGGSATNGTDYTGITTAGTIKTVSFAAGSATAVVTVDPTADTTVEADETVALTLATGSGYTIGTAGTVTGTITNDDVAPSSFGLFADSSVPTAFKSGAIDPSNYELGTKFVSSQNGSISALKYYRGAADADDNDVRTLRLWGGNGTLLGSVTVTSPPGAIGWQVGTLASPIAIAAGETYVVSYGYVFNNNSGALESYALTENYFSTARTSPSGTLTATFSSTSGGAGVYSTNPGSIPTQTWNASNYWVDVAFSTSGTSSLPSISLDLSPASVAEDGTANLIYTFTRSGSTSLPLSVNYTVGGSATNGTDYTGISTAGTTKTVTFLAGSATAVVTVDPTAETTVEPDETVALTLAAGTGYTVGTTGAVTGTITNDDVASTPLPSITLSLAPASVAEDGTANLIYTFTRSGSTSSPLSVNYTVGGSATNGTDYTGISTAGTTKTVTFLAGSATAVVTVDPTAETTVEPDETVALTLAAGTGYTVGTTGAVTGTITNDDVASTPLPSITLSLAPASVAEDGTANLIYTFTRSGSTSSPLIVNYTVGGTATNGNDYSGIPTSVSFAAGSATASVTVDPTADSTVETDETVALTLAAGTGYTRGTTAAVVGSIINDDIITGLPPGSFREDFNGPTLDTGAWQVATWQEHGGQTGVERTFVKDGYLNMVLVNDPAKGILNSSINTWQEFGFGKWEARLKPTAVRGVLNSFFTIDWDKLSTPGVSGDGTKQEIDIEFLTNSFGSNSGEVHYAVHAEGRQSMNTNPDISLGFNPSDDFHVYGFDIKRDRIDWLVDGRVKFSYQYAGNDITINSPYQLKLNTWTSQGGWVGGLPTPGVEATYQIDWIQFTPEGAVAPPPPALPSITLATTPAAVMEDGTTNLVYTFTRTGDLASPLSVNYTVGGTATIGSDYTGISTTGTNKTVTFAANSATATVTVNPTADTAVEANETVALTLAAGTGYSIATTGASTGTITNDDVITPPPPAGGLKGWQLSATNTGLAPFGIVGSQLPVYTGPYEIPAGSYITGVRFTDSVSLYQGNITIDKCIFQPTSASPGMPIVTTTNYNGGIESAKGKVVIRDSEFDGSLLSTQSAAYATGFLGIADLQRNYIHDFGSGIGLLNTGTQFDSIIEGNYVTKMIGYGDGATTGNHSDAFTIRDFTDAARPDRKAIIRNNRFNMDSSNATGSLFLQAWSGRIDNVTIEGNLLEGAGYNLVLEANQGGYSNISAIDNRFTPTGWGATYWGGGEGWTTWQNNYLYNPTMPNGMGAAVLP